MGKAIKENKKINEKSTEHIYYKPEYKKKILYFYSKYKPTDEPIQLLVDLLSNDEVLIYLDKYEDKDVALSNVALIEIIYEKFPEWNRLCMKKNHALKEYTKEQKAKALEIITNGDPLKYCLDVISKKHIGEEHILLLGLISGVSSGLRDRKMLMHLMGVGGSGKGKTDALENVGQVFSNYEITISASPKSIFYKAGEKTLIDNGILFFPENDIKDLEFQALERVLTDDKDIVPKHETVINQTAKSLEIEQINVLWRNSVGTTDDEDNQVNNRYYIFNVDESEEQDEQVYDHIIDNWNINQKNIDEELIICKIITDLIKNEPVKIIIPYIRNIELTFKDDRRTVKKFLRLISVITYFYRFQRAKCDDMILSEVRDFNLANLIWNNIYKYESSKLPELETNIIEVISKHDAICLTELAIKLKMNLPNLSQKIKKMEEKGLVYSEKHAITTFNEEHGNRVTKPKKHLFSNITPPKTFRYVNSEKKYDLAIQDLRKLNITKLEILGKRYVSYGTVFEVRERKEILKFLKILFEEQDVSHFLNNYHNNIINNNNNKYINTIDTKEVKIQKKSTITEHSTEPQHNDNITKHNDKIDVLDVLEDLK